MTLSYVLAFLVILVLFIDLIKLERENERLKKKLNHSYKVIENVYRECYPCDESPSTSPSPAPDEDDDWTEKDV